MTTSDAAGEPWRALVRGDLATLPVYQAIQSPEVLAPELGLSPEAIIKLDGNENPYGCSPRVQAALATCPYLHIYPDPAQVALRRDLSAYTGVGPEYIVAGSGSDEIIDLLLRLVLEPGDSVINAVPTFGMYDFSTRVCGGRVIEVPRKRDFQLDVEGMLAAVDGRTKIIFVANPNNPTGTLTPVEALHPLLHAGPLLVVDEAYYEFSGQTVAARVPQHDKLVVLRTFSKWAGLAGLRVGYGLMPPGLAQHLLTIKPPYNVNMAAEVAVRESLADRDYLMGTVGAVVQERERLYSALERIPYLRPWPSQANFILCAVTRGDARSLHQALRRRGIFIRYFDTPRLRDTVRITVGRPEHTDAVVRALEEIEP
ncbi:MAG: histidinol-phosphate transaminase [Chloroflexi bacterium]|nr:histidinol-phosphate transaminase [Chloroflexota bacterium]